MAYESASEEKAAVDLEIRASLDLLSDQLGEDRLLGEVLGGDDDAVTPQSAAADQPQPDEQRCDPTRPFA